MKTNLLKRLIAITAALTITLAIGTGGVYAQMIDNNDGTITDTGSSLVWLKNVNCFGFRPWASAMSAAGSLQSGMCGLTDKSVAGQWRLPSIYELQSMVGKTAGFTNMTNLFWSSTTSPGVGGSFAFYIDINRPHPADCPNCMSCMLKTSNLTFWPVRALR